MNKIILISGTSGSGKSTFALKLAIEHNIKGHYSTDFIREVVKNNCKFNEFDSITKSSYESDNVLPHYLKQCIMLHESINAMINRAIKENISLIIEGVHIIPNFYNQVNIKKYLVVINDELIHKQRFYKRQQESLRKASKYIKYFKNIRCIQNYLILNKSNATIIKND